MSNPQTRARRCADAIEAGHVGVSGVQATLRECADHIESLQRDSDHYRTQWERLSERHTEIAESLRLRQNEVDRLLMLVRSQEHKL